MLARLARAARGRQNEALASGASCTAARDREAITFDLIDVVGDRISEFFRDGSRIRSALEAYVVHE